ncbi:MAG: phosphocholine cytidylyltransferase family protein [Bdellovibrionales bacterium]|nr:phosphocholine cytidylyltransferase family protein [Bdellovibrionales bacterium]
MKAIVLAAGQGSRLKPLTDDRPKCMVEYQGKALVDYILETLRTCSIDDITLVKGYLADTLVRSGTKNYVNPLYARTNMVYTLFCAQPELNDDVVITYSDIIYRPNVLESLLACSDDFAVVIDKDWRSLWESRMENPLEDAETLKLDTSGFIKELGKKPSSYSEIEGQYIGLIKISKTAIPAVIDFYHHLDKSEIFDGKDFDNMYMTSFIQLIIDRLMPVKAVPIHGGWLEVDCPTDLSLNF